VVITFGYLVVTRLQSALATQRLIHAGVRHKQHKDTIRSILGRQMDKTNFQYSGLKGFLNIDTLSPNSSFYYKISGVAEISMAWWACNIAFFDKSNLIIYHRPKVMIAWMSPYTKLNFVKWSKDGNYALIFEYERNKINDYVLLDLLNKDCYRINSIISDCRFLEEIKEMQFEGINLINKIIDHGGSVEQPIIRPISKCFKKWYPSKAKL
jgi:hypothetical protein